MGIDQPEARPPWVDAWAQRHISGPVAGIARDSPFDAASVHAHGTNSGWRWSGHDRMSITRAEAPIVLEAIGDDAWQTVVALEQVAGQRLYG